MKIEGIETRGKQLVKDAHAKAKKMKALNKKKVGRNEEQDEFIKDVDANKK